MYCTSLLKKSAFAISLLFAGPGLADVIELRADEWCPYNCEPGSDRPGYLIELAREALAMHGHELRYETMNWPRSIQFAREGRVNGIVGAVRDEAPDFLFGPALGTFRDVIAFRRGEVIDIHSEDALEGLRVGAINGYDYVGPVGQYIEKHRENRRIVQFTSGDNALEKNLRKLQAGRLDIVAEVHDVLAHAISRLGMEDDLEILPTEDYDDIFIAFSPAQERSQLYADQLADGLERLRSSGRYAEILAQYGLEEPAQ